MGKPLGQVSPKILCRYQGEAQGETPRQAVLEAARKHYEKDEAVSVAGH